jgi:hypothetical protein
VEADVVSFRKSPETYDIILAAIGEVDSRTHDLENMLVSLNF